MNEMKNWIAFGKQQADLRQKLGISLSNGKGEYASQKSIDILVKIAEDPLTDANILNQLCWRSEPELKMALAENPNTPWSTLVLLAFDESADVRFRLAEIYGAPLGILSILEKDENPFVSCRAARTMARLQSVPRASLEGTSPDPSRRDCQQF